MKTRARKIRTVLAVLAPALIFGLGSWVATSLGSWAWLSGSDYVPDFSDLKQITATAGCVILDPTWSLESETCDPNGRAHNYPELWARGFAAVGWSLEDTHWLGVAFGVIMVLTLGVIGWLIKRAWRASWAPLAIWLVMAVSPPFWLALDRGNSDIMIFAILLIAISLTLTRVPVFPSLVIALSGVLKIFALGSGLMLLTMQRHR